MRIGWLGGLGVAMLALSVARTPQGLAQTTHADAKAQVEARDAKKHNKLKTEGVPTAGGAVAGGVVGGPAGAFAGARMGHTVGSVFHGVKKHHEIKEVEKHGTPSYRMRRAHTVRTRGTVRRRVVR